jgi:hypothetical protein
MTVLTVGIVAATLVTAAKTDACSEARLALTLVFDYFCGSTSRHQFGSKQAESMQFQAWKSY